MSLPYANFSLILVVTHACNLACDYCYAGAKFRRRMPRRVGDQAIARALASVADGGTLHLGFFGGEPLLEATNIARWLDLATAAAQPRGITVRAAVTTNGTLAHTRVWALLRDPRLAVTLSCDGPPALHDAHRPRVDGRPSSPLVQATLARLVADARDFEVLTVVRPDTVAELPATLAWLAEQGVRSVQPSLDLWTAWDAAAIARLEAAIDAAAAWWYRRLPAMRVSWFDEKLALAARVPIHDCARCGFGTSEVAVTPAGRLYPCERLVGEDRPDNPAVLPGDVFAAPDFLTLTAAPARGHATCTDCAMAGLCNTTCRCANLIRSGDVRHPDRLLCRWNQACLDAVARQFAGAAAAPAPVPMTSIPTLEGVSA